MELLDLARIVHVISILAWIGGVTFVTLALLPAIRAQAPNPAEAFRQFMAIERRFAFQARLWVLLAGGSGYLMLEGLGLSDLLLAGSGWWLQAMVALWAIFAVILFLAEPLFLDRWLKRWAAADAERTLRWLQRLHLLLLAISLGVVAAGIAGAHGSL